jgi:hypothetical protein
MAQRYGHISTDARRTVMEAMDIPRPKLLELEIGDDATAETKRMFH